MNLKRSQNKKYLILPIFLWFVLFLIISLLVSYFLFHNSAYFSLGSPSYVKYKKAFHDKWIIEGTNFLNSQTTNIQQNLHFNQTPQICIGILTRKRRATYVTTMIASLFLGNSIDEIVQITKINILNTEDDPNQHSEIEQLKWKIPFINFKNSTQWNRGSIDKWHIKENYDYLAALETCEKSSANWTIIFEEDIVLTNNFISIFKSLLMNQKEKLLENVGYIKLWTTDRWDGFENQDAFILILSCAILSLILTMIIRYLFSKTNIKIFYRFSKIQIVLLAVFLFLLLLSNSLLIGKQQIVSIFFSKNHHLKMLGRNHGSGTVAIAYSKKQLNQTVSYLKQTSLETNFHIDVLIGKEMLKQFPNLKLLEISPSLVQHIGVYSSGPKNQGDFRKLGWDSRFRMTD